MQALILAGGLGTRLRPVVADRPKAMAPIAGRPFLEHLIADLRRSGFVELILCVGYRAEQITAHFGDGAAWGVQIQYSFEASPLGTGGALKQAEPLVRPPLLVLNGDTYFNLDLTALVRFHEERRADAGPCLGTLALVDAHEISSPARLLGGDPLARSGRVTIDRQQRILGFEEKPHAPSPSPWISAGIYVLERALFALISPGRPVSLETELFPRALESGALWGYPATGFFVDIGTPEGYALLERHVREGNAWSSGAGLP